MGSEGDPPPQAASAPPRSAIAASTPRPAGRVRARLRLAPTPPMLGSRPGGVKVTPIPGKGPGVPATPVTSEPQAAALEALTRHRNAWIELDLGALEHNLAALRSATGDAVEIIAVVKANAYGHGVRAIAPALEAAGAERFAVVSVAEALQLRESGVAAPVIVLGHAFPADAEAAVAHALTLTVDTLALGEALAAAARAAGKVARVHIKADTGLHRFGLPPGEAIALAHALRDREGIEVEGLWTHMANADEADDSFSAEQHAEFETVTASLSWIPYRHAANTATALRRPELRYEGERLGLGLYGAIPDHTPDPGLRPVLSLKARLARIAELSPGEGVSYGLTWRAERPARAALVPIGYADGWRRGLGNRGTMLVRGHRCPIIGRVCMDHFLVDVTDVPGAAVGDEAVLIGTQGAETITATEVAEAAGTISWDVLASLGARLPRLAHRGGVVEAIV